MQVNAQHGGHCKGRAPRFACRRMRLNQSNQFGPRHHQIHLTQKLALARALGHKLESGSSKAELFHRCLTFEHFARLTYADVP